MSFSELFNAVSNNLPVGHGIREAGGNGNCVPFAFSYLLFGDPSRVGLLRELVFNIYSDSKMLERVMTNFPNVNLTNLDDWKLTRVTEYNQTNPLKKCADWDKLVIRLSCDNEWFMEPEIWVLGQLFKVNVLLHLSTNFPGEAVTSRVAAFYIDTTLIDVMPEALAQLKGTKYRIDPPPAPPANIAFLVMNDYHVMPIAPFGGKTVREDAKWLPWAEEKRTQLWLCTLRVPYDGQLKDVHGLESARIRLDSLGRPHVVLPSFGPINTFLRSTKHNQVNIVTHASDYARVLDVMLAEYPAIFAICLCGDGCTDLNGTRIVNMMAWWQFLRPLVIKYNLVSLTQSQYAAEDSPQNKIEHAWNFASKLLTGLVCPAFFPVSF